jgi:hypothetical protein
MKTVSPPGVAAEELLRGAHRQSYRYPPGFRGFTAALRLEAGSGQSEGSVEVELEDGKVVARVEGADDAWAADQIRSLVAHRLGRRYEDGDGLHEKRLVEDGDALGALVELDDSMESSYRVDRGAIALVTRRPGGHRFSIAVQSRMQAPGGTVVPTAFAVFYWAADDRLEASEAYVDAYVAEGAFLLPAERLVVRADDGGILSRRISLSGHVLRTDGHA